MRPRKTFSLLGGVTMPRTFASPERPAKLSRIGILQVVSEPDSFGFKALAKASANWGHIGGPGAERRLTLS
jgi:hypothetical protein